MNFPPLGSPFVAIILRPPTTAFVRGEVVRGKALENGAMRIRSWGAKDITTDGVELDASSA